MKYEEQLLRRKEVEQLTSLSRTSIYRLMARNDFPQKIELAPKIVVWRKSEVLNWINEKVSLAAAT